MKYLYTADRTSIEIQIANTDGRFRHTASGNRFNFTFFEAREITYRKKQNHVMLLIRQNVMSIFIATTQFSAPVKNNFSGINKPSVTFCWQALCAINNHRWGWFADFIDRLSGIMVTMWPKTSLRRCWHHASARFDLGWENEIRKLGITNCG